VATRSPTGAPSLTPLWFVIEGGRLFLTTGRATLAARNAELNPEICVLLDAEGRGRSDRVLRLRGRATVLPQLPSWRVLARFALKYYLGGARSELTHAGKWRLRQHYYGQGRAAVIEVVPESAELLRLPA